MAYDSDDSGEQPPVSEQRKAIENTLRRLIEARQAVNRETAQTGSLSAETSRQFSNAIVDTISVLRPYSDHEAVEWDSVGSEADVDPSELEESVLGGRTAETDSRKRGAATGTKQVPARITLGTQIALFYDLVGVARTLGFMPSAEIEKEPVIAEAI